MCVCTSFTFVCVFAHLQYRCNSLSPCDDYQIDRKNHFAETSYRHRNFNIFGPRNVLFFSFFCRRNVLLTQESQYFWSPKRPIFLSPKRPIAETSFRRSVPSPNRRSPKRRRRIGVAETASPKRPIPDIRTKILWGI